MFQSKDPKHAFILILIFLFLALATLFWGFVTHSEAKEAAEILPTEMPGGFDIVDPPALTGQLLYEVSIQQACEEFGFDDPALIMGIVETESNWNPDVVSRAGARGLMQVVPVYAADYIKELGITDIMDPVQNIRLGTKIFVDLYKQYDGNTIAALMFYNEGYAGPARYFKTWEPSQYARKVLTIADSYREEMKFNAIC